MNKVRDYHALEREYITSQISLRELCRRHGITAHSLVVVQAQKGKWQEKREQYRAKASDAYIQHHAINTAAREAQVRDHALDAIEQAVDKFRKDLRATKSVRQPDGSVTQEPAWYMTPKDFGLLIDRLMVLFERPSLVSQHKGLEIGAEVTPEVLREFLEATRDVVGPQTHSSPLPGLPRRRATDA